MSARSKMRQPKLSAKEQKKFDRESAEEPLFAEMPAEVAQNGVGGSTFDNTPASNGLANLMSAASNSAATASSAPAPMSTNAMQSMLDASRANNSGNNSAQQQQSQAPAGNSLFGTANNAPSTNQTTSLFGNTNNNAQTSQPANTSSLFGGGNNAQSNTTGTTSNLFGGTGTTQSNTTQPAGGTSLFGNNQPSLFGNNSTSNNLFAKPAQPAPPSNLFGASVNPPTNTSGGPSLFGASSSARPAQQSPSLLGATQHAQLSQSGPFGRLSMGQTAGAQPQAASQVTVDNLRPTTRFEDCADNFKQELEDIDKMIKKQEEFARQIEAFLPKHEENVKSLQPDIELIKDKTEDVEQALASGARGVDAQRQLTEKDKRDFQRIERVATNLQLPQGYQYPNSSLSGFGGMYASQQRLQQPQTAPEGEDPSNYDTDLIGNYFVPMASELQKTMANYAGTLSEIEAHLRVIEDSTVMQAQRLAQQGAGMGDQGSGEDTVRMVASTLRVFEEGILQVAGQVGECREGVTQLVLGRLSANGY
ncbi:hypothetical protein HII31_11211, partial [Pseudocercospora fuligena]